jgi:hypothetical protein
MQGLPHIRRRAGCGADDGVALAAIAAVGLVVGLSLLVVAVDAVTPLLLHGPAVLAALP